MKIVWRLAGFGAVMANGKVKDVISVYFKKRAALPNCTYWYSRFIQMVAKILTGRAHKRSKTIFPTGVRGYVLLKDWYGELIVGASETRVQV